MYAWGPQYIETNLSPNPLKTGGGLTLFSVYKESFKKNSDKFVLISMYVCANKSC